jgi:hypothetical protein
MRYLKVPPAQTNKIPGTSHAIDVVNIIRIDGVFDEFGLLKQKEKLHYAQGSEKACYYY